MSRWLLRRYLDATSVLGCCGCGCGFGIAFIGIAGTAAGVAGWRVT